MNLLLNKDNKLDAVILKHMKQDPVLNKRQRKVLEFYLTRVDNRLSNKETLNKIAMYFGYEKRVVLKDLKHIEEYWSGIKERAEVNATAEYETIKKEPSPA